MEPVYTEMLSRQVITISTIVVAAIVGVFAVLGPMGTYDSLTAWERLAFGALYAAVGTPLGYSMTVVTAYFLRRRSSLQMALALAAAGLFVSLPIAAVVLLVDTLAHPHFAGAASLPRVYIQVATVGVVYNLFFLYFVYQRVKYGNTLATSRISQTTALIEHDVSSGKVIKEKEDGVDTLPGFGSSVTGKTSEALVAAGGGADVSQDVVRPSPMSESPEADDQGDPVGLKYGSPQESPPLAHTVRAPLQFGADRDAQSFQGQLWKLLPKELGRDVVVLQGQDHYVQVRTSAGSALIKMRFADAVAELGDAGIQVHRSYWVANRHIQAMTKQDRKLQLRLSGDHQVPIGARHREAVQVALQSCAKTRKSARGGAGHRARSRRP